MKYRPYPTQGLLLGSITASLMYQHWNDKDNHYTNSQRPAVYKHALTEPPISFGLDGVNVVNKLFSRDEKNKIR